jgi:hypothetical protein
MPQLEKQMRNSDLTPKKLVDRNQDRQLSDPPPNHSQDCVSESGQHLM